MSSDKKIGRFCKNILENINFETGNSLQESQ